MSTDLRQLTIDLKQRALCDGFDLVGIAPASPSRYRDYFRHWLDDGQAGTMSWLASRFDERTDPTRYLAGAQVVICLAINYHAPLNDPPVQKGEPDGAGVSTDPLASNTGHLRGKIARYALGDDYHDLIKSRLHRLADWMRSAAGDPVAQTRCSVDTAPLMEKELAARAGIGWVGKNNCLIHPSVGSWLVLGEIITTLPLPIDHPMVDRCGTCTRCLDACPTGALTAPYQLDARKCISYLTIEHRGDIATDLAEKLSGWLFGCDICQDVCPWNNRAPLTHDPALQPRFPSGTVDLQEVLSWGRDDYAAALRHSAIKRVKLPVLQRNAAILLQNAAVKR